MLTEEMRSKKEVAVLLEFYRSIVNPEHPENRFRGCLYNKVGNTVQAEQLKMLQTNVPRVIGQYPVDLDKWV